MRLAATGATVVAAVHDPGSGAGLVEELAGDGHVTTRLDVTDPLSIEQAAERVQATTGRLDVLVNNAAAYVDWSETGSTGSRALDEARSQLLVTPRKPRSNWSRINKERVDRLTAAGLMLPAGLAVVEAAHRDGSWTSLARHPRVDRQRPHSRHPRPAHRADRRGGGRRPPGQPVAPTDRDQDARA